MFIIHQHKSLICVTELVIVLIEFTLIDKSTSNQRICENSNIRNISYFKGSSGEVEWNEAWSVCNNSRSTLPVICNQHEQDALTNFIKANIGRSAVWTSGKRTSFNEWKWVDGQPFYRRSEITAPHEIYTHVTLKQDRNYWKENPNNKVYYLCHYLVLDSLCNTSNAIYVTNGCVRPSDDDRTWYDARSQCLKTGRDLAVLTDADLDILRRSTKLNAARSYWIGLRKSAWYWARQIAVPSDVADEEISFTNWSTLILNSLTDNCLSIDSGNGGWIADKCYNRRTVICQRSSDKMTSSKSSSTMSNRPTTTADWKILLYSGIGAGIVIIIICIIVIVIVLALKYTRKSNKDTSQPIVTNTSGHNKLDLTPNKRATSLANAPVNAPVAIADDTQGVYAEISLATVNEPENGAKPQQHGIVYASLDFEKEPTYAEVN